MGFFFKKTKGSCGVWGICGGVVVMAARERWFMLCGL